MVKTDKSAYKVEKMIQTKSIEEHKMGEVKYCESSVMR